MQQCLMALFGVFSVTPPEQQKATMPLLDLYVEQPLRQFIFEAVHIRKARSVCWLICNYYFIIITIIIVIIIIMSSLSPINRTQSYSQWMEAFTLF